MGFARGCLDGLVKGRPSGLGSELSREKTGCATTKTCVPTARCGGICHPSAREAETERPLRLVSQAD